MQSIWIFETMSNNIEVNNNTAERIEEINGYDEKLTTQLFTNEEVRSYIRCNLVMDEVISIRARALGEELDQVIVKNNYDVLVRPSDGTMIAFANKKAAMEIRDFFKAQYQLEYEARTFDLNEIMETSNNVRKTQFKNVTIETLSGSSLSGQQVHNTEVFDIMHTAGELTNVAVAYPFRDKEASFTVSIYGSVVMYSNLSIEECLELLDELFNI
ncbi:hypothetical protein [Salinicoccus bachuensis]|uniref:Uncharacterized protein n=1 Tax=Salinicoccus bachuensis TaxID=3136731 RepID=A0ABZ3CJM2_9STAP